MKGDYRDEVLCIVGMCFYVFDNLFVNRTVSSTKTKGLIFESNNVVSDWKYSF